MGIAGFQAPGGEGGFARVVRQNSDVLVGALSSSYFRGFVGSVPGGGVQREKRSGKRLWVCTGWGSVRRKSMEGIAAVCCVAQLLVMPVGRSDQTRTQGSSGLTLGLGALRLGYGQVGRWDFQRPSACLWDDGWRLVLVIIEQALSARNDCAFSRFQISTSLGRASLCRSCSSQSASAVLCHATAHKGFFRPATPSCLRKLAGRRAWCECEVTTACFARQVCGAGLVQFTSGPVTSRCRMNLGRHAIALPCRNDQFPGLSFCRLGVSRRWW
ncbi:hypothetical protein LZ30DRAFT_332241 [Colletotrichum cereale]|nr:hypothetical protein LZ30DRAFT_332241 [Colletotrichum cereale]